MLILTVLACATPAGKKAATDTGPEPEPEFVCPYVPERTWPGCRVEVATDAGNDGENRQIEISVYDSLARLEAWQYVNEADDTDNVGCTYGWQDGLDPWGAPWPLTEACDGRSIWTYAWTYTAGGEPEGKVYDRSADGVIDRTWAYDTDGQGRILIEYVDEDADGTADSTTRREYDADGNPVRAGWDYDGDGTDDHARTWTWQAVDWGFVLTREERDDGVDGTLDGLTTWEYDANGNLDKEVDDKDGDGSENATVTWVWVRLSDDTCRVEEVRTFEVGVGTSIATWLYDDAGVVDRIETDWDADGKVDDAQTWTYDCGS